MTLQDGCDSSVGEQSVLSCDTVLHSKFLPIVFKGCSAFKCWELRT